MEELTKEQLIETLGKINKKSEKESKKLHTVEEAYKKAMAEKKEMLSQNKEMDDFLQYLFPKECLPLIKDEKGYHNKHMQNIWITKVASQESQEIFILRE